VTNLRGKPFALIGVHVGGSTVTELKAITEKERITWRTFADVGQAGAGPIATRWNLSATPTFYVIDHAGVIRHKWAGPPSEKVLDAALEKLVRAAEAGIRNPQ
jgi:hypothetical protein